MQQVVVQDQIHPRLLVTKNINLSRYRVILVILNIPVFPRIMSITTAKAISHLLILKGGKTDKEELHHLVSLLIEEKDLDLRISRKGNRGNVREGDLQIRMKEIECGETKKKHRKMKEDLMRPGKGNYLMTKYSLNGLQTPI